ncbi:ABC transporter substrate-binding protein [Marinobacterium sp. 3-1745]|uniref:ABC transporter substrate-binding protein n=2 Tax=Marinobacterium marinum TaxID=2756129 RepID=A0A7W1X070_9GAMM|nr:ABC transporter substrate-binding protein [Marinobacterium marinum]
MLAGPAQATPERIVSADGALTEILYALGADAQLAGVDTTSLYPPNAQDLPQIGYKRALSVEGVLSLNPDLMLLTDDAGPEKALLQLDHSRVPMHTFSSEPTLEAVREKILGVARLLDKLDQGQALWQRIAREVDAARAAGQQVQRPVKVLFVLGLNDRSPLVAGRNSHADTMIKLAGGINVIDSFDGYKTISPEAVAMTEADVVLMMEQRNQATTAEKLFKQPGFSSLPAATEHQLIKQDGLLMLGFGPRIGQAVRQLHAAFYPATSLTEVVHAR